MSQEHKSLLKSGK